MKVSNFNNWISAALIASLAFVSCKKDSGPTPQDTSGRGTKAAVMVSTIAWDPDGRKTYVGAFDNVPSGSVNSSMMLEFGNAYFYAFDGSIFVWERDDVKITRYEVSDSMKLTKGNSISLQSFGFKYGADLTFVSPTKAIMMVSEQNKVIVWDPSTMKVTSSFDAGIPVKAGFDSYPGQIGISGNYMYYTVFYSNYDNLKIYPNVMIAAVPIDGGTEVKIFEDTRILPGISGYVSQNGDVYVMGSNDASSFKAYSAEGSSWPNAGILRIKKGELGFDPGYHVDLNANTGSKGIVGDWKIDDDNLLVRVYDPLDALPAAYDDYYGSKNFISQKINIKTGEVAPYPGLAKGGFSSNIQDWIDNVTYFPLPNSGGTAEVAFRLKTTGIEEAFQIPGAGYWGMRRIR